jgi:hypothetical protein
MKWRVMLGLSLLMIGLPACSDPFGVYSPERIHRTVQSRGGGLYVVYYEWRHVEQSYGKDRDTAVPAYLKAKDLVPFECARGVTVVRGNKGEGGKAWAEFRCNE